MIRRLALAFVAAAVAAPAAADPAGCYYTASEDEIEAIEEAVTELATVRKAVVHVLPDTIACTIQGGEDVSVVTCPVDGAGAVMVVGDDGLEHAAILDGQAGEAIDVRVELSDDFVGISCGLIQGD